MLRLLVILSVMLISTSAHAIFLPFDLTGKGAELFDSGGWQQDSLGIIVGGPRGNNSVAEAVQFRIDIPENILFLAFDTSMTSLQPYGAVEGAFNLALYTESGTDRNGNEVPLHSSRQYFSSPYFENPTHGTISFTDVVVPWTAQLDQGLYWMAGERSYSNTDELTNEDIFSSGRHRTPQTFGIGNLRYSTDPNDANLVTAMVPEPATIALFGSGLAGAFSRRRKKKSGCSQN